MNGHECWRDMHHVGHDSRIDRTAITLCDRCHKCVVRTAALQTRHVGSEARTSLGYTMPGPHSTVLRDVDTPTEVNAHGRRVTLRVCASLSGFGWCKPRRLPRGRASEARCANDGALWRLCRARTRPSTGARSWICIVAGDATGMEPRVARGVCCEC